MKQLAALFLLLRVVVLPCAVHAWSMSSCTGLVALARTLSHFIASLFDLAEIDLQGHCVPLVNVSTEAEPMPPSRLIGQVHQLAEKADLRVVLVLLGVSSYIRSRLIESRMDFVVPSSQLFPLSFLMSLPEHHWSPRVSLSVGSS